MFVSKGALSKLAFLLLALVCATPEAHAVAAPNSCLQVFTRAAAFQPPARPQTPATAATTPMTPSEAPIGKPNGFNLTLFETMRDRYVARGIKERPKTPEAKAALVAAALRLTNKQDVVNLEEWVRTASPSEIRALTKSIGRIDPRKGISPKRAELLFLDILEITHNSKPSFRGLVTRGFKEEQKRVLLQWARTEFMQKPFLQALDSLGLVKDPGIRDVVRRRMMKHPNASNIFKAVFQNAFFMTLFPVQFAGVPVPYVGPKLELLKSRSLSAAVKGQITRNGLDAAYGPLHQRYGKLARFELAWNYARHVATGAMIAYAVTQIYPGFVSSVMPEGYIDPEQDNAFEMGAKVLDYYTRLSLLVRWDGIKNILLPTPKAPPARANDEPQAAPLPDALPPGANAEAATDQSMNEGDSAETSTDYAPPAFDTAPDMPPDVPAAALPPAPASSGSPSAAAEPSSGTLEF
ncbi:MAG: hypothetical protein V4760_15040 [Bdellovibrionota bacterium]